ncbi:methionyl-tRNA formyltransferase, partial [Candidatus Uhrbacteria bacterium]|nr:methionyl-tRNA formyltransferase [Candidatus Uhrbacteria bacterium]
MIRVVFYGTSSLGIPSLKALLHDSRFSVVGVITQPDRPAGRHAKLQSSPVKQFAVQNGLPIHQFEKVKSDEAFDILKTLRADVALVASFGQLIPQQVLDLYPHGIMNIHPSLLPKYRGSTPIQAPIKNGDKITGVSIMKLDALMDHGPLLAQVEESIRADETGASLEQRLSEISATIVPDTLFKYVNGKILPQEQNHEQATVVKMLSREDGLIDWMLS